MELKEGMYVRTDKGEITKIIDIKRPINADILLFDGNLKEILLNEVGLNIKKASYNIIDLIEVGDYVNGYPVYETIEYTDNTRAIVIADDNKSIIWEESSQHIKSIVTKEMFSSMSYKVGD